MTQEEIFIAIAFAFAIGFYLGGAIYRANH
jgi:hypothetical protein